MRRLWTIKERNLDLPNLNRNESLFTVGNGYLGTRGTFEEGLAGELPSTLVHGVFHQAEGQLTPELAPFPNWLWVELRIDGTPLRMRLQTSDLMFPPEGVLLGFTRELDLRHGILRREVLFRAASGSVVRVVFERFASLAQQHLCAQRITVRAVDGNPHVEYVGGLDLTPLRSGAAHWKMTEAGVEGRELAVSAMTVDERYSFAMRAGLQCTAPAAAQLDERGPAWRAAITLAAGEETAFTKLVALTTSRDGCGEVGRGAEGHLHLACGGGYELLRSAHEEAWDEIWDTLDVRIEGDDDAQRALRFALYHIAIAAPRHDSRVSIGAKTLSGPGYKGHVFWDTDIYIVPALTVTQPAVARNLLLYRYANLDGARRKAAAQGYRGAMYPWESADTGEEVTPEWLFDSQGQPIRVWTGSDEQHISSDVAYAVHHHWRFTGDDDFMQRYGAEIILDTALFWASRVERRDGRYEITRQIPPDEYREHTDNSAFVNRMVMWHLQTALEIHRWLRRRDPERAAALDARLGIADADLAAWQQIAEEMYVPFDHQGGFHEAYPGFSALQQVDVQGFKPRHRTLQTILGTDRVKQSQVIKQADIVMLMALLGSELLNPPLSGLSSEEVMERNWERYAPLCDQGSSLSAAMHAMVAARLGRTEEAYDLFELAAGIDLADTMGNVREGIHAATCGGLYQAVIFGFCGLHINHFGKLALDVKLPEGWKAVHFKVYFQGEWRALVARAKEPVLLEASGEPETDVNSKLLTDLISQLAAAGSYSEN